MNQPEGDPSERTITTKTLCRDCIFAEWSEDKLTQTGCELGRIDKFEDRDKLDAAEEDGIQYFVINTFCNACRNDDWAKKHDDPKSVAMEQIKTQVSYIVTLDKSNIEDGSVYTTLKSILMQELKPIQILFASSDRTLPYKSFYVKMKEDLKPYGIPFQLSQTVSQQGLGVVVDKAVRLCKGNYYCSLRAGTEIPPDYALKLDKLINEEMRPVIMMHPDSDDGSIVQVRMHGLVRGNETASVQDKIKELAREQGQQRVIIE